MTPLPPKIEQALQSLASENLISQDWSAQLKQRGDLSAEAMPWHSRALVGFGAWLSSLLLIGFMAGIGTAFGGFWFFGMLLIILGLMLCRNFKGVFWEQIALAASLAGQAFVLFGVGKYFSNLGSIDFLCSLAILINLGMLAIFPSNTHRFLSTLFIAGALITLIFENKVRGFMPLLPPLFLIAALWLQKYEARSFQNKWSDLIAPLFYGCLFASFISVSFSAGLVFDSGMRSSFSNLFPHPWIASALTVAALLWLVYDSPQFFAGHKSPFSIYGFIIVVGLLAWNAPGILLSLTVWFLGVTALSPQLRMLGLLFISIFTVLFFYGMDVTFLTKSLILMSTGLALLVARKVLV
jgi:hypothetical protein